MSTLQFTDSQISILQNALETRITRIEEMIAIFSKDSEDKGSTWMVAQYRKEKASIVELLKTL